jgi:hypothetical protein
MASRRRRYELRRQFGQPIVIPVGRSKVDGDVLAVDIAVLAQSLAKCDERRCPGLGREKGKKADPVDLCRQLRLGD